MASSGIVLNGSTATWTITAADCATLPLGTINASLLIWYGTRLSDTVTGTLNVRDTSLGAATTTGTWSSTLSVALSQTSLVSESAFSSTLTFTNAGSPVSPTYVDWRLSYQPEGSVTLLLNSLVVTDVIIAGAITYKGFPEILPHPVWPSVQVDLYDADTSALLGSTTTDANGLYEFKNVATDGENVYVDVPHALPPGETFEAKGTSATEVAIIGVVTISLLCLPIIG